LKKAQLENKKQEHSEENLQMQRPCAYVLSWPDVLERQELSLNMLVKLAMSLILEKHVVVLEYFPASLKILE